VNTDREKTGDVIPTSQGNVVFTKDTKALDNPELAAELKEKYPRYIKTVTREAPIESGRFTMTMPDMSHIFRKPNRMSRQEREEEERERATVHTFDQ
jgi:hypothetical protein